MHGKNYILTTTTTEITQQISIHTGVIHNKILKTIYGM